jgi:hypothetical protein
MLRLQGMNKSVSFVRSRYRRCKMHCDPKSDYNGFTYEMYPSDPTVRRYDMNVAFVHQARPCRAVARPEHFGVPVSRSSGLGIGKVGTDGPKKFGRL